MGNVDHEHDERTQDVTPGVSAGPGGGGGGGGGGAAGVPGVENPLESPGKLPDIPGYAILKKIAEGGQGAVYQAVQESPHRKVAIKVLLESPYSSKSSKHRFEREIDLVATLRHPHIVAVFASGKTADGHLYYVMDYVRGMPLTEYVRRSKLPLEKTLALFATICEAVNHAHQKGVMHRDLKPGNIIVDGEGNPHILDFGLAKQLTDRHESMVSMTGQVIGTLPYMSPEQVQGNPDLVDIRTDVYALGVILYELLTGVYPYPVVGAMAEVMGHIANTSPKPLTKSWTKGTGVVKGAGRRATGGCPIDDEVETIALKSLSKERERRYQSAGEFGRDIQHYLDNDPIEAKRDSGIYLLKRALKRYRLPAATIASAGIVLVGATVLGWKLRGDAAMERDAASVAALRARAAERSASESEQKAVRNLSNMYTVRGLENHRFDGSPALWFAEAAATVSDNRQTEANLVRFKDSLRDTPEPIAAVEHPGSQSDQLDFNPMNARYLISSTFGTSSDNRTRVWDLASETEVNLPPALGQITAATWNEDGKTLLVGSREGSVAALSFPALQIAKRWEVHDRVASVAPGPGGEIAAAAGSKLDVWNGEGAMGNCPHYAPIVKIGFSTTGALYTLCNDDTVRVFQIEQHSPAPTLRQVIGPCRHVYANPGDREWHVSPCFVKNGDALVLIDERGSKGKGGVLKWYDLAAGQQYATTELPPTASGSGNSIWDMIPSPDGRHLLTTGAGGSFVDIATATRGTNIPYGFSAAINAKGDRVIFGQMDHLSCYVVSGTSINSSPFEIRIPAGVSKVAYSSDGSVFASFGRGLVRVWKLPSSQARADHPIRMGPYYVSLSPDGKFMAPTGVQEDFDRLHTLNVRSAEDGSTIGAGLDLQESLAVATFSPSGRDLATATGLDEEPKRLRFWAWETATQVAPQVVLPSQAEALTYCDDGTVMAVYCREGQVILVNPVDGKLLNEFRAPPIRQTDFARATRGAVQFSHDGNTLFTLNDTRLDAWDWRTGKTRYSLPGESGVWCLAEYPDKHLLAAGTFEGNVYVWDAATGKTIYPPLHHPREVTDVQFSPDGMTLCTTCQDAAIRMWSTSTGSLRETLGQGETHRSATFTKDGHWLVTDSPVKIWDTYTGYPITDILLSSPGMSSVQVSPDGRKAVISGRSVNVALLDLAKLTTVPNISAQEARQYAEIVAAARILKTDEVGLDNAEWLDRWRSYRKRRPEVGPFEFP